MTEDDLRDRQQRLLMRSTALRIQFGQQAQGLKPALRLANRAQTSAQWLVKNPMVPLTTLAAVVALRPRRALSWGGSLWWAWTAYRRLRKLSQSPLMAQGLKKYFS